MRCCKAQGPFEWKNVTEKKLVAESTLQITAINLWVEGDLRNLSAEFAQFSLFFFLHFFAQRFVLMLNFRPNA